MALQVGQPEKDQNSANSDVTQDSSCSSPVLLMLLDEGTGATTAAEQHGGSGGRVFNGRRKTVGSPMCCPAACTQPQPS